MIRVHRRETADVLWSIVTVAAFGVLLGFSFRAPALLAATALTVGATGLLLEGPVFQRIVIPVVVLQCAYLVGLMLASLWRRLVAGDR